MSVRVISDVFKFSQAKGTARLVLIALADVANDEGEVSAYARSEMILMRKANCGRTAVKTALAWLITHGEIVRTELGDGRRSSCYEIHLEEGAEIRPPEVSEVTPWGPKSDPLGAEIRPPISPSSSVNVRPSPSRTHFDEFWGSYPRRIGKGSAVKSWDKAVERADPVSIAYAAKLFADHVRELGTELQFVPHPATWLNRDGWEDDLSSENQPRMPRGADATLRSVQAMRDAR